MAPTASTLSPAQRATLIAVVMLLLLLASLAGAYAFSISHNHGWSETGLSKTRQRVGDLRFSIPRGWHAVEEAPAYPGLTLARAFEDPDLPERRLVVGLLHRGTPQHPATALNTAINILIGADHEPTLKPRRAGPIAAPPMVGWYYVGTFEEDQSTQEHSVAVLTQDGRRYWVLYLSRELSDADVRPQQLVDLNQAFTAICSSATDEGYREAQPRDIADAGLSSGRALKVPDGLSLLAPTHGPPGAALSFIPLDSLDRLRMVRVRGVPDADASDPADPLEPQALLAAEIRLATGGPPAKDAVRQTRIGPVDVWQATMPQLGGPGKNPALLRELWYARLASGHAAVLESIADPMAQPRLNLFMPKIVAALADAAAGAPDTRAEVRPALDRGASLALLMRRDLPDLAAPGWRYELIERDTTIMGWAVTHNWAPRTRSDLPLHGTSYVLMENRGLLDTEWGASRDGNQLEVASRETAVPLPTGANDWMQTLLEQRDGTLSMARGHNLHTGSPAWATPTPPGFLPPMALNHWPAAFLRDAATTPALVWVRWGSGPPIAYWLDREPEAAPTTDPTFMSDILATPPITPPITPLARPAVAEETEPAVRLLLWPMMGLDPTRITCDAQGLVLRTDRQHQSRTPSDPDEVTYRMVDRTTLVKQFPKLQAVLDEMAKKEQTP